MILNTVISPYQQAWHNLCHHSEMVKLVEENIELRTESISLNRKLESLYAISHVKNLRQREITGNSRYKRNYSSILKCRDEIDELQSAIEKLTGKLEDHRLHYNICVIETIALIAATIFAVGACGGLLITGLNVTEVLLVGLVATISLISREIFCAARNYRQLITNQYPEAFRSRFESVTNYVEYANAAADVILQGMVSRRVFRPLLVNFIYHCITSA